MTLSICFHDSLPTYKSIVLPVDLYASKSVYLSVSICECLSVRLHVILPTCQQLATLENCIICIAGVLCDYRRRVGRTRVKGSCSRCRDTDSYKARQMTDNSRHPASLHQRPSTPAATCRTTTGDGWMYRAWSTAEAEQLSSQRSSRFKCTKPRRASGRV